MSSIKKIIYSLVLFFFLSIGVSAKEITIHLFYSSTCPHCIEEKKFLNEYLKENNDINLELYEVTSNKDNSDLLDLVKKSFNSTNNYVPYTVIGEVGLTGYSENIKLQIKHFVEKYRSEEYIDVVKQVIKNNSSVNVDELKKSDKEQTSKVVLPILGKVDSKKVSLPLIASIIGFVDGFNPCAIWILIFLISMLLGTGNKKRMIILGLIFLTTSALIYLLFMMAWLNIMLSAIQVNTIKILIGFVAIAGALFNLRSYYKSTKKDVGCEIVDNSKRKKIMQKIKKFVNEKSLLLAIIGIIGLAISVNFIEFACSAGWPVVFTEILALNDLDKLTYFGYILIYIFFYLLDDIIIFMIAMFTLEITGISNKYSKYSHLIGGILMLLIGLLMIFKPDWLMLNF